MCLAVSVWKADFSCMQPGLTNSAVNVNCNAPAKQARRLDVRLRAPRAPGAPERKDFVHMLNCTLTATERTLCCVLETYQTPEGVRCASALPPSPSHVPSHYKCQVSNWHL